LTIAIAAPKTFLSSLRTAPGLTDFYAEISANPTLCQGADEYGLLLRASGNSFYRYSLSCDGQARLDRILNGQASSPQPWVPGALIPIGAPSAARLAVWASGKTMRFFVNDAFQFEVNDPTISSGQIGVFARAAGDSAVTVSFRDLIIRAITP
jgi:hypothetical protein